jgi:hypothetical protein
LQSIEPALQSHVVDDITGRRVGRAGVVVRRVVVGGGLVLRTVFNGIVERRSPSSAAAVGRSRA